MADRAQELPRREELLDEGEVRAELPLAQHDVARVARPLPGAPRGLRPPAAPRRAAAREGGAKYCRTTARSSRGSTGLMSTAQAPKSQQSRWKRRSPNRQTNASTARASAKDLLTAAGS